MAQHRAPPPSCHDLAELEIALSGFLSTAKKPLVVITGPTASGKTALSVRLAEAHSGEIINGDSRQFYRGMDLGTAKVTSAEMQGVPHHLLDFLEPDTLFTVAEFKELAEAKIEEILARRHVPFLVGGSGLFVDAICKNLSIPRVPPQADFRRSLEPKTSAELYEALQSIDPASAAQTTPTDRVRLIRTLEIYAATQQKPSELKSKQACPWQVFKVGIHVDPEELDGRIAARTEAIWQNGFLEEVRRLQTKGYDEHTPAMIAHGYREALQVLCGKMSEAEAKHRMTLNTRRYAKRQRTWWRKDEALYWVSLDLTELTPQ